MDKLEKDFLRIWAGLQEENKTIHCLTNPIAINDMANVILSLNQSPIMADNPKEVGEIAQKSSSVLLNLGNIQDYRMEAMKIGARSANKAHLPLSLDLVGISASSLRLDFALELLDEFKFDLIKGNYSEIFSLENGQTSTSGVDSKDLDKEEIVKIAKKLGDTYGAKILASGKEDILYGANTTYILKNGDPRLKKLTGTGCILGAISASCLAIENSLEALALGVSIENISSEGIESDLGLGSFKINLLDNISLINMEKIKERIKYEKY